MSILSEFEDRIGRAVEGVFAGVFRSPVQPAELARACAKEMDRRKKLGVGKVYAPTLYSVLLSPEDGDALGGFAETLAGELETYLTAHARERCYELSTRPRVRFLVADDLKLGRYEVIGELLSEAEIAAELGEAEEFFDPDAEQTEDAPDADETWGSAEPTPAAAVSAPVPEEPVAVVEPVMAATVPADVFDHEEPAAPPATPIATITVPGVEHDIVLSGERMVIGRLRACDICLPDVNASREHAALVRDGAGWAIEDLGSTNGTLLGGRPVKRERLADGDVITIGISELVYHEPRG